MFVQESLKTYDSKRSSRGKENAKVTPAVSTGKALSSSTPISSSDSISRLAQSSANPSTQERKGSGGRNLSLQPG